AVLRGLAHALEVVRPTAFRLVTGKQPESLPFQRDGETLDFIPRERVHHQRDHSLDAAELASELAIDVAQHDRADLGKAHRYRMAFTRLQPGNCAAHILA